MSELQIFNFEDNEVRTQIIDDEPWFVGKDVSDVLGYSKTNAMTRRLNDEDFMSVKLSGMNIKSILINESGLYAAVMCSKLDSAEKVSTLGNEGCSPINTKARGILDS